MVEGAGIGRHARVVVDCLGIGGEDGDEIGGEVNEGCLGILRKKITGKKEFNVCFTELVEQFGVFCLFLLMATIRFS